MTFKSDEKICNHHIGVEDARYGTNSVVTINDVYKTLNTKHQIKLTAVFEYCPECGEKLRDN